MDVTIHKNNVYIERIPKILQENREQTQKKDKSVVSEKQDFNLKIASSSIIDNNTSKPRPIISRYNSFSDHQNCLNVTSK